MVGNKHKSVESIHIKKIISGGQTGADQAGLLVGKHLGISTGGWIPKGCITQDGKAPHLLEQFDLQEHTSYKYSPRTYCNVRDSNGTIRFARNFQSAGERCTLKAIIYYRKPYFDFYVCEDRMGLLYIPKIEERAREFKGWIKENNIRTLNVAGNSEKSCPGIELFVFKTLVFILKGG